MPLLAGWHLHNGIHKGRSPHLLRNCQGQQQPTKILGLPLVALADLAVIRMGNNVALDSRQRNIYIVHSMLGVSTALVLAE